MTERLHPSLSRTPKVGIDDRTDAPPGEPPGPVKVRRGLGIPDFSRRLVRLLSAFAAGALTVAAFAPFELWPLPLFTLAWLFRVWLDATPARALRSGLAFGLGLMGFGVFWLHISIDQFGNVGTPLAIAVTLLFVLGIATFYGLAGWLAQRLPAPRAARLLLVYPALWVLVEWLRGWVLTGFPWLSLGYSQIDSPLAGYAPLLGVYGSGWLLALSAGLLAGAVCGWGRLGGRGLWWLAPALLIWLGGALLARHPWTEPLGPPLRVGLVQPSIPQERKWRPEARQPTLDRYAGMTLAAPPLDLVVWPETAVPDFLHRVQQSWLTPLARQLAATGTHLLTGIPVMDLDSASYYNAAVVAGRPGEVYYKRHLVPFGEYLPFKALLGPLLDFLEIPMSDFTAGAAAERPVVRVGELEVGVSICYEDAFGAEVRQALPGAAYLVNLSNDAWFGDSLAPFQHLEIARMRALETGRPLVRSTNSGISALIDARGRVIAATGLFEPTLLHDRIQPMQGSTPFVAWGNGPVLVLMALSVLVAVGWRRLRGG